MLREGWLGPVRLAINGLFVKRRVGWINEGETFKILWGRRCCKGGNFANYVILQGRRFLFRCFGRVGNFVGRQFLFRFWRVDDFVGRWFWVRQLLILYVHQIDRVCITYKFKDLNLIFFCSFKPELLIALFLVNFNLALIFWSFPRPNMYVRVLEHEESINWIWIWIRDFYKAINACQDFGN